MHIQLMASAQPAAEAHFGIDLATPGDNPQSFDARTFTDPDLLFIVGLAPQQRPYQTMIYHVTQGPLFTSLALATVIGMFEQQYRRRHLSIAAKIAADWQKVLAADQAVQDAGGVGIKNLQRFTQPPRMPTCVGRALWSPRPSHPEAVWFFTHACFDIQTSGNVMHFTTNWAQRQRHFLAWADPGSPRLAAQALVDVLLAHAGRRVTWLAAEDRARVVSYYHEHNQPAPPGYEHDYAQPAIPLQAADVAQDLDNAGRMTLGRKDSANAWKVYQQLGDCLTDEAR